MSAVDELLYGMHTWRSSTALLTLLYKHISLVCTARLCALCVHVRLILHDVRHQAISRERALVH
jgi:hypothetical protein